MLRALIELCADCDTCRTLMEEDCVFFPRLYRLWDQEKEEGIPISAPQLRELAELCTACGLCPCPRIPAEVIEAKSRYVAEEGLKRSLRFLNDVPRMARLCGMAPGLIRALQSSKIVAPLLRRSAGIHPDREFPVFPRPNFFDWAKQKGLDRKRDGAHKVAYFAGCTAGYLFPEVARALVEVLERNGANVYVPDQVCCGMPQLLEGDREAALERAASNLKRLLELAGAGYQPVTSCPTCGYLMTVLFRERAYYSDAYQESVKADAREIKVPDPNSGGYRRLAKSVYYKILKDDGYFSALPPLDRIALSDQLSDAGRYLLRLHAAQRLDTGFAPITGKMVYFTPCHQREQKMGRPYLELMKLIPGLEVEPTAGGETACCGMGGNFGFKEAFHEYSLTIGGPLMEKIKRQAPEAIVTDCLSCRMQFRQLLPYPVFHPIELLARAYQGA